MKAKANPNKHLFNKGLHVWATPKPKPPSEDQVRIAKQIAEKEKVNIPKVFTKEAYSQFIRNYGRRK